MGQPKAFKFKFPDGRDPRVKKRALTSVMVFLFCLLVLSYNNDYQRPESCSICHVMVPHVRTWEASAHSQSTTCVTCHQEPGFEGFLKFQTSLAEMTYRYLANKYYMPITVRNKVSGESCYSCHALTREMSPSGDLIVPHARHEMVKVNCMECHKGVVHANISYRYLAIAEDTKVWTRTFSSKQMTYEFRNLSMRECLECHNLRRADTSCAACHKDIDYPPSHFENDFMITHGSQAFEGIQGCDECHSWTRPKTLGSGTVLTDHPIRDYVRSNTFCVDCHLNRPEGHHQNYRGLHGYDARRRGDQGCQVCHDYQQQIRDMRSTKQTAANTNCISCHVGRHKGPWQLNHSVPVWGQKYNKSCIGCHSTFHCGKCHQIIDNGG